MATDPRIAIRRAPYEDEEAVVKSRLAAINLDEAARKRAGAKAAGMVSALRADPAPHLMERFLSEYGLSTDEGVALMCLAEAYLRVPDAHTLDALIRDKIGGADWGSHRGQSESLLLNASSWGLMLTGRLYGSEGQDEQTEAHLIHTMRRMVQRVGEPVVRAAVAQSMKVLGAQFVLGRNIEEALRRAESMRAKGYRYSYDMLGEAARTREDAEAYFRSYSNAISAIGKAANAERVTDNPSISVKLSALHPRYETVQKERVLAELVPTLVQLMRQAKAAGIGLTVDAEEADRLDLSLQVMERALSEPEFADWDGFGFVVQAFSKASLPVLHWIVDLAERLDRRFAVRLVKGAYWDYEIKQAQILGLAAYPVFTRKPSTDVSYLAGASFLLAHCDRIFPQFATHNAHTACAILEIAPPEARFEFQRLHGMGEALHERLRKETGRPCRIYAPVGIHKDLLAYLVRRLLENGANSSFVHQLLDEEVPAEKLVEDPISLVEQAKPVAHPLIPLPPDIYEPDRKNSKGWNLNNPLDLETLSEAMRPFEAVQWRAAPLIGGEEGPGSARDVFNPAHPAEKVGVVVDADADTAKRALGVAADAVAAWQEIGAEARAEILERAATLYEENAPELIALASREAGKTRLDGVLEVREAADFLRYYASEARRLFAEEGATRHGRGVFVCISPWNFPLAIFTGQLSAALVAGNAVVAKPAEQSPLTAAKAVALLHEAGVPKGVLNLVPGEGSVVGSALTSDPRVGGVCFTGSTDTAILIDRALAKAGPVRAPLIAETGGLNAMIVDSTALPEHAVRDIVQSAFQSAGQRCSALRALFVQEDVAPALLKMLKGATEELVIGDPWDPATDVGPVIDEEARQTIETHVAKLTGEGRLLFTHEKMPGEGNFVAPVALRLDRFDELEREIFGPVLHVITFKAKEIDAVVAAINASGYGLTLGIHSRIDQRVERICDHAHVGNIYVNRNQIGAVVGVQPFGGEGLSGTGPKAGGPHYLARFTRPVDVTAVPLPRDEERPQVAALAPADLAALPDMSEWEANSARIMVLASAAGELPEPARKVAHEVIEAARPEIAGVVALPGPTGEANRLSLHGRGLALCLGASPADEGPADGDGARAGALLAQVVTALAAGNRAVVPAGIVDAAVVAFKTALERVGAPAGLVVVVEGEPVALAAGLRGLGLVAYEGGGTQARTLRIALAERQGARLPLLSLAEGVAAFATERVVSIDTTASGGNATLLTLAGS
ncbi:bifunctional proline dehydrogenase/L-glutamate gamma-semialdehyde dehydrogenase PutA [Afifella marina]|uniref:Bifunctional protein PutA n=1 Tax=Afifella marina DSM 2698 TaxID=1120955 RepID=A0A1G5NC92_AFIMA|nr:bifunctional proline dehydrogenase/L-glutamate gamma-semialdehyde dehydrogenase PutA [Afifella marina]MBK1623278.1 bifunctional proline dehydrogenase/L-glutamate gamma-semialdehyde dehydrogenase PutA [Afifella marina DSM 2698]MBK1626272.1 bifunctional proline dehydrogenase/L-glutamate gamma-semialdehyde dehydrogenase PutA [Afifella marina]MBK5917150.1 bifunctional proline dehydrogenase/L-glutamate gamma-semialdehyde dehydrogenase [Afifella marina]RAI22127.1 bifunctional proline dehydrogenase